MSNAIYKKDLHDVALAVAQASKAYTDKKAEEVLWQVGEYAISTSDDNTTAYRKTVPANATRCKIKRIYGNSVKYTPTTASDSTIAYQKNVPSYSPSIDRASASMNILGGMSYKVNQLSPNTNSITFTTSQTDWLTHSIDNITINTSHKYLITIKINSIDSSVKIRLRYPKIAEPLNVGVNTILVDSPNATIVALQYISNEGVIGSIVLPQNFINVFDLTADFGSGNEPTSVSDCATEYAKRGIDIYSYTPQQSAIRDTAITNVKSVGTNLWWYSGYVGKTTEANYQTINVSSNPIKKGTYTMTADLECNNPNATGIRIAFRNSSQSAITAIDNLPKGTGRTPKTFTLTEDCYYIFVYADVNTNVNSYTSHLTNIMLNEGNSALPYDTYLSDTLAINSNIQALDGYGVGISNSLYNYVDFNSKKFKKQVISYTFTGDEAYSYQENGHRVIVSLPLTELGVVGTTNGISNTDLNFVTNNYDSNGIYIATSSTYQQIFIGYGGVITDNATAKAYLVGKTIIYELATPVETDISEYLDGNEIEIEPNGTLSFESTYSAYVPSNVSYNGVIKHALATAVKYESFNVWDEEWELGSVSDSTGENVENPNSIRPKNYIPIIPNSTYYIHIGGTGYLYPHFYDINKNYILTSIPEVRNNTFVVPANAYFMKFGTYLYPTTYNHDVCINISGTLNGTYKHHKPTYTLALTNNEAKYSWGITTGVRNVRDYTTNTGSLIVGNKDLGELTYAYLSVYDIFNVGSLPSNFKGSRNDLSSIYSINQSQVSVANMDNMSIEIRDNTTMYIKNTNYTDGTIFKNAMNGYPLFYEKNTTDTEQITPIDNILVVEEGDTLTFINEEGLPVPSDITYRIEVAN